MRITERRLRSIIRSVILEAASEDDIFRPFPQDDMSDEMSDDDEMEIIDADDIHQLDQPAPQRRGRRDSDSARQTRDFMARNRSAGVERDRGDRVVSRGHVHPSQLDMLDDMGELGNYDEDDY